MRTDVVTEIITKFSLLSCLPWMIAGEKGLSFLLPGAYADESQFQMSTRGAKRSDLPSKRWQFSSNYLEQSIERTCDISAVSFVLLGNSRDVRLVRRVVLYKQRFGLAVL